MALKILNGSAVTGDISATGNVTGANLNISNWDTAFSWGNHASAGYLTSYTETDTLDSVTGRGNTTTNGITIGNLQSTGVGSFAKNYIYGQVNYHIALNEDSGTGYIGNVNGSPYMANASYYGSQIYNVTASQTGLASVYVQSNGDILFLTNTFTAGSSATQTANQRMVVKGNGNVGIGAPSPSEKLEVAGSAILDADNARLKIKGGVAGTNSGIDWTFNTDATSYAKLELDYDDRATTGLLIDSGYPLTLDYSSSRFAVRYNGAEQMRVNTSGNVGIGTTSPSGKLHIKTNASSEFIFTGSSTSGYATTLHMDDTGLDIGHNSASRSLNLKTGSLDRLTITGSGNVGIGTTSPAARLHVSDVSTDILTESTTGAARNILKSSTGEWRLGTNAGQSNNFWIYEPITAQYVFNIDTSGNVGIGTNSPAGALHVQSSSTKLFLSNTDYNNATSTGSGMILQTGANSGNTYGQIYAFQSGNTAYANLVVPGGNLGIGTTGPAQKLDVRGNASFGDGSGVTNIYADNAYTLAGFDAPTFTYSYAGGDLLASPATAQVTWLGSALLSGNITPGVIPQGGVVGLSNTGLQDNINGPGGYAALLGGGISYRDPSQPFAPAGYPDIGTSAAMGGFVTYGNIISHTGAGAQDGAAFGSPMGTGDVALFEGPVTFTYRYGSGVLTVEPVNMQFAAFDYLGSGGEMRFDPNAGALFAPSFSPTSDKKLKDNIAPINNGLDVVTKLSGKEYDWKSNGKKSSGFIAQEVEEIIPHAVTANSDTLTLNYNAIIAYQNEAIKELKGMIDNLKQEIEILKNK